jgi:hydroxylaminobenzene mutase
MENPRMGLSSHLEGTMNGMLLIIIGIVWPKLHLSIRSLKWAYGLALFGTFMNWLTTLLAGIWGAGAEMMPLAGGNHLSPAWQEGIIKFGLVSLSIAMVIVAVILVWGMRGNATKS